MYNVLIMDDEPWSRQVVKSLGEWDRLGLKIVGEAEDGYQGVQFIAETMPHIVITDMRMPGLEGVELLQTIHDQFPSIKILVMSGYDDFVYLKQAIQSRAINYMLKPIHPEELNASLSQCVEQLNTEMMSGMNVAPTIAFQLEAAIQDRYLSYRKLIYGHLLDLNSRAIEHAFTQLAQYLSQSLQDEAARRKMPIKLAYDFITILEELLAKDEFQLAELVMDVEEYRERIRQSSLLDAAKELSNLYTAVITIVQDIRQTRTRLNIDEVKAYVHKYYQDSISLETIAKIFAISKEHLSRAYKAGTGENISDAILRLRMEKARDLIVKEGVSIKRASEMTGYSDIAYFYRVFKKHYGMPPGNLRK
ncbi:hypothetical protein A3844_23790 [Paenibacillus helianthi]|uniref:DNA-binding response regulator n=1 Tax=Paenibacillus helianthi TaxID=1349432 RepID=A0ABX3EJB5_9BACL|nr:response regulator [Paenibacillus helianthi]OKP82718.1 hypothetical protein A3844_23790 [Paenibacillus helianthi]